MEDTVRDRLAASEACTRTHAFAEVFSTLTGSRLGFRVDADDAAEVIRELSDEVEIVEISAHDILGALGEARSRGVRGGQVHDYLHAVAARRAGCKRLVTLNGSDFEGIFEDLTIASA